MFQRPELCKSRFPNGNMKFDTRRVETKAKSGDLFFSPAQEKLSPCWISAPVTAETTIENALYTPYIGIRCTLCRTSTKHSVAFKQTGNWETSTKRARKRQHGRKERTKQSFNFPQKQLNDRDFSLKQLGDNVALRASFTGKYFRDCCPFS